MWRNPSGGFAAEDSRHRRRKGLPQATKQGGIAAEKAAKRQELLLQQHSTAERRKEIPPMAAKGFNLVCANLLFMCADSRFAKPRISLKKVLFVAVRSCSCGALIRGLRNLESPRKGKTVLFFSLVRKEPKVPEGLRPSRLRGRFKSPVEP